MNDIANQIPLEVSHLAFERAAVCLHFQERVLDRSQEASRPRPYDGCPVLESMELDLLSLAFQSDPPIESRCLNQEGRPPTPVEIVFPDSYDFFSEGRNERRRCAQPVRQAEAMVSYTCFRHSRWTVWHLALVPRSGESFTELDIIRLIHLYDGRAERSSIAGALRFRIGKDLLDAHQLLTRLVDDLRWDGLAGPEPDTVQLRAGTISVLTGEAEDGEIAHVLHTAMAARGGNADAAREFNAAMAQAGRPLQVTRSLCGLVTGILDFAEVDDEEALDTLQPTYSSAGAFHRVNRSTLLLIADSDRAYNLSRESTGISPYLTIPHSVLIHNEANIEAAEASIAGALEVSAHASIDQLESARRFAEQRLRHLHLPNIFNYETERALFDRGRAQRGGDDRMATVLSSLQDLQSELEVAWEARRDLGQKRIATLLAVISVVQLEEPITELIGVQADTSTSWTVVGALALGLAALVHALWGKTRSRSGR